MSSATSPMRYPDVRSAPTMTKRAWWLVVLNTVLPGSAQVLAGDRRLGRFGLRVTLTLIIVGLVAGGAYLLWPAAVFTIFTNSIGLWVAALGLAFCAVVWAILSIDTIRLARLVRAAPKARPLIAGLAAVLMVVTCGTAAYGAYVATTASGFLSSVFSAGPSEPPVDGRYNILLLGGDAGPGRDGLRPDSISVVSIDAATGQATMIGLPRDLANVPFPAESPLADIYPEGYGAIDGCDVSACMLNSIYTEMQLKRPELYPDATAHASSPGIEAMRDAAQGVTGLTIQYFVLIDMQGFTDLIDALGGVDINVKERLPIGGDESFNNVDGWVEPGQQHMNGYTALWYGRARHGTSDYDRMGRQRVLQQAILKQFNPANVLTKFQAVAQAGAQVVKTDVPQGMLGYFVDLASKTKKLPIKSVELVPKNNVNPEQPDYGYIRELINTALAPPAKTPAP